MREWHCVKTRIFDDGNVVANIVKVMELEDGDTPSNFNIEGEGCDIYYDWFPSEQEALNFIEEEQYA